MQIFISGGCKNGKSAHAERVAIQLHKNSGPLYYIATMTPTDYEDEKRIARHQNERAGANFTTIEQPRNIEGILEKCDTSGSFLLDSLTALLANEMFLICGSFDKNAHKRVATGLEAILTHIENIVIVSDYIYSDAVLYDPLTELYRKSLAHVDRLMAAHCDVVLEVTYGQIIAHKGGKDYDAMA
ncbi:MAG: bifunctional adenosylcobinamide kinase/adenosylcobinamide-phosphate guanylyltransferase [Defluviitaleaceae bacterium]|nr:bifunctional adenosylcobinamide kinase/adenosylcobinamide-phosphate guanylyltransferase [Defluviitaleaceae bacterium]